MAKNQPKNYKTLQKIAAKWRKIIKKCGKNGEKWREKISGQWKKDKKIT